MTQGTVMPREWHKEYNKGYYRRPEVKAKRAAAFQARMADPAERQKILARRATRNAIRRGEIFRAPCEICGCVEVDSHHDDYAKPLDVRWLCRTHHNELHGRSAKAGL